MAPSKRALSPIQKWEIIIRIFALWCAHPDMRLTQLVRNIFNDRDIYHIEDLDFIEALEEGYREWPS
jgi:hypothetical protein